MPKAFLQAGGSQETDGGAVGGRGGGGGGGEGGGGGGGGGDVAWLLEEERVEDLWEAEQARLCEQLIDEESQPLDCEDKVLLRARLMPWCLRALDACLAHMDATTLFHCEAAMSLASLILAHLPSLPYDWQLGHVLCARGRGRGQGSKRRPGSQPSAQRAAASSPAPWPLECIERAVAMLNHVPPEASATADSPMCRMMRVCRTPLQPALPFAAVRVITASCRACCCQQPPCHGVRVWRIRVRHPLTGGGCRHTGASRLCSSPACSPRPSCTSRPSSASATSRLTLSRCRPSAPRSLVPCSTRGLPSIAALPGRSSDAACSSPRDTCLFSSKVAT